MRSTNASVLTLSCVDSIHRLRQTVSTEHTTLKQKELETMPKASHGYGGKFGVQNDRMDKVRAVSAAGGGEALPPPPRRAAARFCLCPSCLVSSYSLFVLYLTVTPPPAELSCGVDRPSVARSFISGLS